MSVEFVIFTVAILVLIAARNWEKLSGVQTIAGDAASGIRGIFSSLWSTGKGVGGSVGPKVMGFVLWIFVLISFGALFPKAFGEWVAHWNIFLVSQIVAILAILFLPVTATRVLMAGAIVVMLWSALDSTFWPEKERSKEVTETITSPIIKTVTVYPGKWETVQVPQNHTFFYECDGWGLVKVLGNRINPKECGPRAAKPNDWFGDNLRTTGGNLYLSFTSTTSKPIKAVVKIWPNSSL